jgi:hypothetical protein
MRKFAAQGTSQFLARAPGRCLNSQARTPALRIAGVPAASSEAVLAPNSGIEMRPATQRGRASLILLWPAELVKSLGIVRRVGVNKLIQSRGNLGRSADRQPVDEIR